MKPCFEAEGFAPMLSVEQCRKFLDAQDGEMSDEQIDELKNLLYVLANVLVDDFLKNKEKRDGDAKTGGS